MIKEISRHRHVCCTTNTWLYAMPLPHLRNLTKEIKSLQKACMKGNLDEVIWLLDSSEDVNGSAIKNDKTPLHLACNM
jgi:hypothetical protein